MKSHNDPDHDRAFKIRPVLDHFNESFLATQSTTEHQAMVEHGLEAVVLKLTEKIEHIGCQVYVDNFFNSPSLQVMGFIVLALLEQTANCCLKRMLHLTKT